MSDKILQFPVRPKEQEPEVVRQLKEMRKTANATTALVLLTQDDGSLQLIADGEPSFYDVRHMLTLALHYTYEAEVS
jgi:hypothetical protein